MAEEIKKKAKPRKGGWGGKREGAGRKKVENPHNRMLTFGVTEDTKRRANALREITKNDTMPFVAMFESWVAELAQDYGIE